MEKIYNKLVRDKIPQIINANGEKAYTRVLNNSDYGKELCKKLQEEVAEFLQDESMEELADVLEVVHGLLLYKGESFESLEKIRQQKYDKRGGFEQKIFLEKVDEKE